MLLTWAHVRIAVRFVSSLLRSGWEGEEAHGAGTAEESGQKPRPRKWRRR